MCGGSGLEKRAAWNRLLFLCSHDHPDMSHLDSDNDSPQEDFTATGAAAVDAASDGGSSSSSGEDSDEEGRGKAPKAKRRKVRDEREEEGLDEGEIEALKQDAGDLVEGKRRRGARKR